jgi:DNA-directed RNA polymerase specialized sigma24 family protein
MGTVTNDELSVEVQQTAVGEGNRFTPEEVAALLERWRPDVLREMGRRRLWRGACAAEREDHLQDVTLILCSREFASEEHLRRALWAGLGFRARDFWKAGRRREVPVAQFFDEVIGDDRLDDVEDAAIAAADSRQVDDCLSELDARERAVYRLMKGEGFGRRKVTKALGLTDGQVQSAIYTAQRKIDKVSALAVAGRLCERRRRAVDALARGDAHGLTFEQARAHLTHCQDCLVAYRAHRAALSQRVASVLPVPVVAGSVDQGSGLGALIDHLRGIPGAVKRQAYELAGRSPGGGAEEAVVGAGGLALGTKVVVTLCVGAAAGGGAICVNQLGGLPGDSRQEQSAKRAKAPRKTKPVKAAQAEAPTPPATEQAPADATDENSASKTRAAEPDPQPVQKDPPQEFFAGGSSSGGSNQVQPSSTSPPPSSSPSSGGGSSSQGGGGGSGGEFFGGG